MKLAGFGCSALICVALVSACGDDDDTGVDSNGGAAGIGGTASAGTHSGTGGMSMSGTHYGGAAGGPIAAGGEAAGASGQGIQEGGAAGAAPTAEGGSPAGSMGGAAAGSSDGGGGPDPARLACPALGETFKATAADAALTPIAAMFGCPLGNTGLGYKYDEFRVQRFEVTEKTLAISWQEHTLSSPYDNFAIEDDCGPSGLAVPTYETYPRLLTRELGPGIYTWVDCYSGGEPSLHNETIPMPDAPSNVDCDHALPLPRSIRSLGEPQYFLWSSPTPVTSLDISLFTKYSSASLTGTLIGVGSNYTAMQSVPHMVFNIGISFPNVPAGNYCLKVETPKGVAVDLSASPASQ